MKELASCSIVLVLAGCGSARHTDGEVTLPDRSCSVVLDETLPPLEYDVSMAQTAAGDVVVHENGRIHRRTGEGWLAETGIPEGTSGSELAVAPSGGQALLANNYTEMMLWTRAPGGTWKRAWVFDEHDAVGNHRALAFADDDTLYVTVRRRYYDAELYRLRISSGALEQLAVVGEAASMTLWVESPEHWWWSYWNAGLSVHHGDRHTQLDLGQDGAPGALELTSVRGLGIATWHGVASYETASGGWTTPAQAAPSRSTDCPEYDRYDESHEGETCAMDELAFSVEHVGGDVLDRVGVERTARGDATWACNLQDHGGSCNWHEDLEHHAYLVAGGRAGAYDRLLELEPGWFVKAARRGTDGDVHAVLGAGHDGDPATRYLRIACDDAGK